EYTLRSSGYKTNSVSNGSEAIKNITNELPDLILLSLRSNDNSGVNIVKNIKEYFRLRLDIAQGAEPPIIALITSRDTNLHRDLQYLGISVILFKPINIQELPNVISSVITSEHKPIAQERKKIIILDGETRSHQFIESVIIDENYDFESCETEAEVMAKLRKKTFDLGIFDISSFENDPSESLTKIRGNSPEMSIIIISAFGGQVSNENIDKLNIQRHFMKPIDVNNFRIAVDDLMGIKPIISKTVETIEKDKETVVDDIIDGLTDRVGAESIS
ncbi:TPA: response regulator, partial [bacterium]|nr:response regulator [bacterium]